jgi:AraC family ethanolamine operon transcriptional activator
MNSAPSATCKASHSALTSGIVSVLLHRSNDVDAHAASLTDWNLRYDQLGRGVFEGRFTDIRVPGIQVFVESTSQPVRQRGTLTEDSIGFGFLVNSQGSGAFNGWQFNHQSLLACRGTDIDMRTPQQCQLAGLVLDACVLEGAFQYWDMDQHPLRPDSVAHLELQGPHAARLRQIIGDTHDLATNTVQGEGVLTSLQWREDLLSALAGVMETTRSIGDVRRASERTRLVNLACQLLVSSAMESRPQSLGEVCRQVGASPRKLGYCFQEVLGLSALEYVKALRLNAVRRELRRDGSAVTSIYDVATRHGFWHFGRFSVEYRQYFGERPSDTLRQVLSKNP